MQDSRKDSKVHEDYFFQVLADRGEFAHVLLLPNQISVIRLFLSLLSSDQFGPVLEIAVLRTHFRRYWQPTRRHRTNAEDTQAGQSLS
jgi:hypothetical protein